MLKLAIPVLHVADSAASEAFYGRMGFRRRFAHRGDPARPDPCYLGLERDGVDLHLSSFSGDGVAGGVALLLVDDLDEIYAGLIANGVPIAREPTEQTWGNREMYVVDPDGNSIRFVLGRDG